MQELEKESSSEVKLLYRLISIFARETYAEYKAFADANAALLTKHGLDGSACEKKMRLLTLVTLGQEEKELSYGTIAKALQVEEGKVEVWVMAAIGAGLLSAKMDQVRQVTAV